MRWTHNYPIVLAAGVSVLMFSLVGVAAVTGALSASEIGKVNPHASPFVESTASAAAAKKANCRTCGTVQSVRAVAIEGQERKVYRVTVRMDDGTQRTVSLDAQPVYAAGARVKVNGNALERG